MQNSRDRKFRCHIMQIDNCFPRLTFDPTQCLELRKANEAKMVQCWWCKCCSRDKTNIQRQMWTKNKWCVNNITQLPVQLFKVKIGLRVQLGNRNIICFVEAESWPTDNWFLKCGKVIYKIETLYVLSKPRAGPTDNWFLKCGRPETHNAPTELQTAEKVPNLAWVGVNF